MSEPQRIPRLKNLTNLSIQYRVTNRLVFKRKLYSKVISHFIQNDFTYEGKPFSIQEFSKYSNIPIKDIHEGIIQSFKNQEILNPEEARQVTRGAEFGALKNLLADLSLNRSIMSLSAEKLISAYASNSKLNIGLINSLAKLMELSNRQSQLLVELFGDKAGRQLGITINNNIDNSTNETKNYLTVEKALELISPLHNEAQEMDKDSQKALKAKHNIQELPNIRAQRALEEKMGTITVREKISKELLKNETWFEDAEVNSERPLDQKAPRSRYN